MLVASFLSSRFRKLKAYKTFICNLKLFLLAQKHKILLVLDHVFDLKYVGWWWWTLTRILSFLLWISLKKKKMFGKIKTNSITVTERFLFPRTLHAQTLCSGFWPSGNSCRSRRKKTFSSVHFHAGEGWGALLHHCYHKINLFNLSWFV